MDDDQKAYYRKMLERDRSSLLVEGGHLVGVITFFVGDDDNKFLLEHTPWTVVEDNPDGSTLYIDQWLTMRGTTTASYVHREFTKWLRQLKEKFVNIQRVKWVRVDANFRKHGIKGGIKRHVHCKNLKF